jgi:hypothetical protein
MIINYNLNGKESVDQISDRANEIYSVLMEEVCTTSISQGLAEMNLLSIIGANLVANAAVNKAMNEAKGDLELANKILGPILADFNVALTSIAQRCLEDIASGDAKKLEIKNG